jgi:epsilon-lactone hydrolase
MMLAARRKSLAGARRLELRAAKTLSVLLAAAAWFLSGVVNAEAGDDVPRVVAARSIPTPDTVSKAMQEDIAKPPPGYAAAPATSAEWKKLVTESAEHELTRVPLLQARFGVSIQPQVIGGVPCFILTPKSIPAKNLHRLLVHVHGGAYVMFPGLSGTAEAIIMAGISHTEVISIDYRMAPDFPYPAAMDDAMAVWKVLVKKTNPLDMAIFGTSTGGGMTLAMVQRAIAEKLPLPAAIAPGTPWSDLSKTGDSYFTNESIDNILGSYDPFLAAAAKLYANGKDLKDPDLSPVYGSFKGFPPSILTSGTRDLFLSNTVRVHRKMQQAGVIAELQVYEGQSHAQYYLDTDAPETAEAFEAISRFFNAHLRH